MSKGGKASRARTKARRKALRRGRKDSMNEQYKKWRDQGINQKSKRFKKKGSSLAARSRGRTRIPFPYHLFCDGEGTLKPGSPHRAWLAMNRDGTSS